MPRTGTCPHLSATPGTHHLSNETLGTGRSGLTLNDMTETMQSVISPAQGIPNLGSIEWSKTELIASKSDAGSHFYLVGITGDSASEVVKGGIEARLKSPAGSNYDLYLYGGAEGYNSGLDTCEGPQASSSNPADAADTATQVWAAAAFGVLSDRLVTVEVRHIAGPCAPFTLELYGAKQ